MTNMKVTTSRTLQTFSEVPVEKSTKELRLKQVCADFESIFVHYILKSARKGLPENGLFDNSFESKIYKSMMDEQMAQCVARGRGIGLGELLYEQLTKGSKASSNIPQLL